MENIILEIKSFLEATGIKQFELAEASGVSTATISRIVTGKQKDILSKKASSLRKAMARLAASPTPSPSPVAASDELHELSNGMVSTPSYVAEVVVQGILEKR